MAAGTARLTQSVRVNVKDQATGPDKRERPDCPVVVRKGKPIAWKVRVPGLKGTGGKRIDGPLENHPEASFKLDYRVNGVRKGPTVISVLAQLGLAGITHVNLTASEIDTAIRSVEHRLVAIEKPIPGDLPGPAGYGCLRSAGLAFAASTMPLPSATL